MNEVVVYLVVTMGTAMGISNQGFGGVSVTPTSSMAECLWLKQEVGLQIHRTDYLHFDDNEILVECKQND